MGLWLFGLLDTGHVCERSGQKKGLGKTYPYLLRAFARPATPPKSKAPRTSL